MKPPTPARRRTRAVAATGGAEAKPTRRRTKATANTDQEAETTKPLRRRSAKAKGAESNGTTEPDAEHQLQVIDTRVELNPAPPEPPRPRARKTPRRTLQQEDLPLDIPQAGD